MFWLPHISPFLGVLDEGFTPIVGAVWFRDGIGPSIQACENPAVLAPRFMQAQRVVPRVIGPLPHLFVNSVEGNLLLLEFFLLLETRKLLLSASGGFHSVCPWGVVSVGIL